MAKELSDKQRDVLKRLGALLDDIDKQTRQPGEPTLRQAIADHARSEVKRRG